jgi:DNA polymerase
MAHNYRVDLDAIYAPVWENASDEDRLKASKRYEFCYARNQSGARSISRNAWVACEIIKRGWRVQNSAIAQSWQDAEGAAREAIESPGTITEAARCRFVVRFGYMWMLLPSGRALCFPKPSLSSQVWVKVKAENGELLDAEVMERDKAEKLERSFGAVIQGDTSPAISYWGVDAKTKQWSKKKTYGGDLVQSATQATARDLLVNGMLKAEAAGYPVVLHTYDEMACEVPRGFGDLKTFEKLICELPDWADGLPLTAGGWRGKRYRKD